MILLTEEAMLSQKWIIMTLLLKELTVSYNVENKIEVLNVTVMLFMSFRNNWKVSYPFLYVSDAFLVRLSFLLRVTANQLLKEACDLVWSLFLNCYQILHFNSINICMGISNIIILSDMLMFSWKKVSS